MPAAKESNPAASVRDVTITVGENINDAVTNGQSAFGCKPPRCFRLLAPPHHFTKWTPSKDIALAKTQRTLTKFALAEDPTWPC